eukprot:TRINITY_DN6817_c0_g2_i2.p1 TRINITY_DN6817_c0_g2~~TRINITY_DN6817_c0_g2_i2.p1  ORF type:complete len:113 (+),score=16.15 TRINITY_DN6817_c0_g2_i2:34-372(+)
MMNRRHLVGASAAAALAALAVGVAISKSFDPSPRIDPAQIEKDGGKYIILRDNRLMEYFVHGKRDGNVTLVAIHGAQTTGKLFTLLDSWAKNADLRIIAPTLPGFGPVFLPP